MKKWKEYYLSDLMRYNGQINSKTKKFLKYLRKCQFSKGLALLFNKLCFRSIKEKTCTELSSKSNIGKGLYIGHLFGITINPKCVIGDNCNIHRGVLIGQENRGKRKGVPTIGNNVWVGANAVLVGKIVVGDDVLIAPNSFVNVDIPSHSVVLGNPCKVIHKDNATAYYINNLSIPS